MVTMTINQIMNSINMLFGIPLTSMLWTGSSRFETVGTNAWDADAAQAHRDFYNPMYNDYDIVVVAPESKTRAAVRALPSSYETMVHMHHYDSSPVVYVRLGGLTVNLIIVPNKGHLAAWAYATDTVTAMYADGRLRPDGPRGDKISAFIEARESLLVHHVVEFDDNCPF